MTSDHHNTVENVIPAMPLLTENLRWWRRELQMGDNLRQRVLNGAVLGSLCDNPNARWMSCRIDAEPKVNNRAGMAASAVECCCCRFQDRVEDSLLVCLAGFACRRWRADC